MTLGRKLLALVLGLVLMGASAMAVEQPSFQSIDKEGAFEVRAYPALVVAEVAVGGDQRQAVGKGFRLLAGYIFGGNQRKQKIAMTAPVTQAPAAASAPGARSLDATEWVVRFTMPHNFSLPALPAPDDALVHLRETPPSRYAVVTFSGLARPAAIAEKTTELTAWMERRHLTAAGAPTLAFYDPPWTLWFLRRNEVMIPVEGA